MNIAATAQVPRPGADFSDSGLMLCLPLLHSDSLATPLPAAVLSLWPGLSRCPENGHWQPANLPFGPEQAEGCLTDMQSMSEAALTGVPLQAMVASENRPQSAKKLDEQEALRHFANTGDKDSAETSADTPLAREAAQKALLWAWLLEERFYEVRDLVRRFQQGAGQLMAGLGVEQDVSLAGLQALDSALTTDAALLPPWKLVLENAALFLPEHCMIIINSPVMWADAAEYLGTTALLPLTENLRTRLELTKDEASHWSVAKSPLWQALGLATEPNKRPWLLKTVSLLFPPQFGEVRS